MVAASAGILLYPTVVKGTQVLSPVTVLLRTSCLVRLCIRILSEPAMSYLLAGTLLNSPCDSAGFLPGALGQEWRQGEWTGEHRVAVRTKKMY